jgi:hypothetical protein
MKSENFTRRSGCITHAAFKFRQSGGELKPNWLVKRIDRISRGKGLALKYEKAKARLSRHSHSSLQITDNREIIADGCRKIVSCDDNVVVLDQLHNRVTITGNGLKLRNWGADGVMISGEIQAIEFEGKRHVK